MADYTFVAPPFLEDQSADAIHQRMLDKLPADIDKTEGGFPWDFTMPTALEKAELLQYHLMEAVKLMHFMFANGIYLDYHAEAVGLTRKSAVAASGTIHLTGSPGVEIPAGFEFAVPANGETAAIIYETTEDAVIDSSGEVDIPIEAQEPGTDGNVSAYTITIMASPSITGIQTISNPNPITGGAEIENDDDLRERIREVCESADASFCGCDADYKRWAMEIDGVGQAIIVPEWNGAGTVKVILIDSNGEPANQSIISAVYNSIVSPDDRDGRKAPIGATVTVTAPTIASISISCTVSIAAGYEIGDIRDALRERITAHLVTAQAEGVIKLTKLGAVIIETEGITDYSALKVNNGTSNVVLSQDEYPVIETLTVEVS